MQSTLLAMMLVLMLALSCASFIPKTDSENDTVKESQDYDRTGEQGPVEVELTSQLGVRG